MSQTTARLKALGQRQLWRAALNVLHAGTQELGTASSNSQRVSSLKQAQEYALIWISL